MSAGTMTTEQLRRAVERAEQRVQKDRPGDEKHARHWLRVFRARLERAENEGRA